jgi:hypothetical protein
MEIGGCPESECEKQPSVKRRENLTRNGKAACIPRNEDAPRILLVIAGLLFVLDPAREATKLRKRPLSCRCELNDRVSSFARSSWISSNADPLPVTTSSGRVPARGLTWGAVGHWAKLNSATETTLLFLAHRGARRISLSGWNTVKPP